MGSGLRMGCGSPWLTSPAFHFQKWMLRPFLPVLKVMGSQTLVFLYFTCFLRDCIPVAFLSPLWLLLEILQLDVCNMLMVLVGVYGGKKLFVLSDHGSQLGFPRPARVRHSGHGGQCYIYIMRCFLLILNTEHPQST